MVEGARLESDFGEAHQATRKHFFAQSIQRLTRQDAPRCEAVNVAIRRQFRGDLTQFLHSSQLHLSRK